jgi:hypothetical protein
MSRKHLFIMFMPVLFLVFWHHPVSASQRIECCKNKRQTQAIAKLKDSDFIRVRTASKREVRGYFRTFDGSRLVIEDRGNLVTVELADISVIKRGRGFWGSLQKGFSRAGRTLASPVTDLILTYQMLKWFNEAS